MSARDSERSTPKTKAAALGTTVNTIRFGICEGPKPRHDVMNQMS